MTPLTEFLPDVLAKPLSKNIQVWAAVLWFGLVTAMMVGFKVFSPNDRIGAVQAKVDALQAQQDAAAVERKTMVRWMCVKSTLKEIALSGLECK